MEGDNFRPEGLKFSSVRTSSQIWLKADKKWCKRNFSLLLKNMCISEDIQNLLGKRAIEYVPKNQESMGFYNTFFLVLKKDGGVRQILNLRNLNVDLHVPHFKM